MRTAIYFLITYLMLSGNLCAQNNLPGQVVIIVNATSPITTLSRKEVADLYLGRSRTLGSMKQTIAIDNAMSSPIRARFYHELTGKDIAEINSYWARLLFAGQNSPPKAMSDSGTVLEMVKKNSSAIGYLDYVPLDKSVRVVLFLGEKP